MKWSVNIETETGEEVEVLRRAVEVVRRHGLSGCIIALAENLKGDGAAKYGDEHAAQVAALYLAAYLRVGKEKR